MPLEFQLAHVFPLLKPQGPRHNGIAMHRWIALTLTVVSVSVLSRAPASEKKPATRPTTAPSPNESTLVFRSYEITMTPVAESRRQGAVPMADVLNLQAGSIRSGKYNGGG